VLTTFFTRLLKLSDRLGTLMAVGTSICGASAIVATAPAIEAEDEEVAYAVANITVFGIAAMLLYPYLAHALFSGNVVMAGLFQGTAIHETAQVTGSALIYDQTFGVSQKPSAADVAIVIKLVRNAFMAVVIPVMALFGYGLQRGILNRTLGKDILPPLLVTFGLSVILQNGLLEIFTADSRKLGAGALETASFPVTNGISIGFLPLLMFMTAVAVIAGLHYLFYRTALGRAFRATSDDTEIALLMGLDNKRIYAFAMSICLGVVAIAGVFLAIRSNFDPAIGPGRLIFGFEAVIIGGLGNLWGTLAGGVILGVAQGIGAQINPGWQLLAGHLAFLIVLAVRPKGLFPRIEG
jgi:branched-chain amino acid transport system permease protein